MNLINKNAFQSYFTNINGTDNLGGQIYKNIERRNTVGKVLVVCSTDGRLKVYYDEHPKWTNSKFWKWILTTN